MSTGALDRIIEEVKALTPQERPQLLAYLDGRADRRAKAHSEQVRVMNTSSDAFAARKAEERTS